MKKAFSLMFLVMLLFATSGCSLRGSATSTNRELLNKDREQEGFVNNTKNPNTCDETCDIEGESYVKANLDSYKGFSNTDHVFYEMTMQDVIDSIKEEKTFIAYFGFSNCPWCIEAMPILNEAAKRCDANVAYINTRPENTRESELRIQDEPVYEELLSLLGDFVGENEEGEKHIYVPYVLFVNNGKVVGSHEGTVEDHDAKEREMTTDECNCLAAIYDEYIKSIK